MRTSAQRRLVLLLLPALGACAGSGPPAGSGRGHEGPSNVLLVTLDTTRRDHLGAYGRRGDVSPNLDALARRGARFEQAVTPVALTRPAHASLLTGLLP